MQLAKNELLSEIIAVGFQPCLMCGSDFGALVIIAGSDKMVEIPHYQLGLSICDSPAKMATIIIYYNFVTRLAPVVSAERLLLI